MGEFAVVLTSMVTSAVVTGAFLTWDQRRLAAKRTKKVWYDATTSNAIFGGLLGVHFVPAFFCCGFHVFATREGGFFLGAAAALKNSQVGSPRRSRRARCLRGTRWGWMPVWREQW